MCFTVHPRRPIKSATNWGSHCRYSTTVVDELPLPIVVRGVGLTGLELGGLEEETVLGLELELELELELAATAVPADADLAFITWLFAPIGDLLTMSLINTTAASTFFLVPLM